MNAINRLMPVFNIRAGEGQLVLLLLAHSCCIGIVRVFSGTAATSLFLSTFGAQALPYVYIGAAIITVLTGFAYGKLEARLSFATLIRVNLSTLIVSLCLFRMILLLSSGKWSVMALAIWADVLWVLTSLAFWGLASQVFNVRQGKRLFALAGSGEVLAIMVGGLLTPALVGLIGTANLLLLAAVGAAGSVIIVSAIGHAHSEGHVSSAADGSTEQERRSAVDLLRQPYIGMIFVLAVLSVTAYWLVETAFFERAAAFYPDEKQLAGVLGIFFASSGLATLVCRSMIAGRFMSRYGLRAGLLALPLMVGAAAAALAATGTTLAAPALLFWLAAAMKLADNAVRSSIDRSAYQALYQPLPAARRSQVQTIVESIVEPAAGAIAGVGLLLLNVVLVFDAILLAYVLLPIIAAMILVAIWLSRAYPLTLMQALVKRQLNRAPLSLADKTSVSVLQAGLLSAHPGTVIYSLNVLEQLEDAALIESFDQLLDHPAAEVRHDVLRRIESLGVAALLPSVYRQLNVESDPAVRGACLRTLAQLGDAQMFEVVTSYLDHPDPAVWTGAMVGMLRSGGIEGVLAVGEKLLGLVQSADPRDRALAAQVVGGVGMGSFYRPLLTLLQDADPGVLRAALVAAGQVQNPRLWPLVIKALRIAEVRADAATALVAGGDPVLPALQPAFSELSEQPTAQLRIVRIYKRIGGPHAVALLFEQLGVADGEVRHQVLQALRHCGYRAQAPATALVEQQITSEIAQATWTIAALRDIGSGDAVVMLSSALQRRLDRLRDHVLLLLSFLYDPASIMRARDNLEHRSGDKRAYAIEALDILLAPKLKPCVLPLFEELSVAQRLQRLNAFFPQPGMTRAQRLRTIIGRGDAELPAWIVACALYSVAQLSLDECAEAVGQALAAPDPLIHEIAGWTSIQLGWAQQGHIQHNGGAAMSTIETVIILKSVPIFAETADDILAAVAGILLEVEINGGERIIEKGDIGRCMYIIVEGRVRVHDGARTLNILGERDVFGEMAVLDVAPRVASVTAMEDTRLFRLDQDALYELMADHFEVARGIIRVLSRYVRERVRDLAEADARLHELTAVRPVE